ncbi:MAG: glycosyltransferase [Parvibaculum sp.]|uniref:CgeB family protein n=1 Tax=Parvibaculum sp. TaxID=2024848 RepID=UPI0032EEDC93
MPRILAVTAGSSGKHSPVTSALRELYGAEILPGKACSESGADRIWRKLGLAERIGTHATNIRMLNRAILDRAGTFDILFVVKGNFVTADTLRRLKARGDAPRIIGWSCDDVYLPHNSSVVLREAAPSYDIFYTAKSLNISQGELAKMGFRDARFLHQGFDCEMHRPLPDPDSRFAGLITFVGFGEEDRFNKMNYLARNGIEVHVWGNGWTRAMRARADQRLHIHARPLFGDDYADALSNSAINLCFLRKLNRDLHTSRSFEIPACGGFMVAERTDEHRAYFEEDAEAVYFDDTRELLDKVQYYLRHPEQRVSIAAAGRQRCLDSDYSYHRLARDMIEGRVS